jgi:hypothetical protein
MRRIPGRAEKMNLREQEWRMFKLYGMTFADYDRMLASQGGVCALCRSDLPKHHVGGRFHFDHDHACCPGAVTCGKCIRGLVCGGCNRSLGWAENCGIDRILTYLGR